MQPYELRLAPSPRRSLQSLPIGAATAIAEFISGPLCANPRRVGKPLQRELVGRYSARIRDYRVIYRIFDEESVVLVLRIEHRADVYRHR